MKRFCRILLFVAVVMVVGVLDLGAQNAAAVSNSGAVHNGVAVTANSASNASGSIGAAAMPVNGPIAVPIDGPVVAMDSTSLFMEEAVPSFLARPQFRITPFMEPLRSSGYDDMLFPETKEERVARYNKLSLEALNASMARNFNSGPEMPAYWIPLMMVAGFFLSAPLAVPYGYYPVMNHSNPFAIALIPGEAPQPGADNKYSPEFFPQTVTYEYDFRTGKYVTKMADMRTFQGFNNFGSGSISAAPVPKITVTPVERQMNSLY